MKWEELSFDRAVGIAGLVLAIILVVLDKAGKLKGGWLYILLVVAFLMTLYMMLGNSWVMAAPKRWLVWRGGAMLCLTVLGYSALAIWMSSGESAGSELNVSNKEKESPSPSEGFVQYESKTVVAESPQYLDIWKPGKVLRINFTIANRGARPVIDNQSWGLFAIVDPALNPGEKLRDLTLVGIKDGYAKFKGSGGDLGSNVTTYNTAVSPPLRADEIAGIISGKLRIHLLLGGAWTDSSGKPSYWTNCEWTNWGEVDFAHAFWKVC